MSLSVRATIPMSTTTPRSATSIKRSKARCLSYRREGGLNIVLNLLAGEDNLENTRGGGLVVRASLQPFELYGRGRPTHLDNFPIPILKHSNHRSPRRACRRSNQTSKSLCGTQERQSATMYSPCLSKTIYTGWTFKNKSTMISRDGLRQGQYSILGALARGMISKLEHVLVRYDYCLFLTSTITSSPSTCLLTPRLGVFKAILGTPIPTVLSSFAIWPSSTTSRSNLHSTRATKPSTADFPTVLALF